MKPRVVGVLYLVDEQAAGPDSYMAGGQAQLAMQGVGRPGASPWPGGYYDYTIKSLRSADAGDTRSNRLARAASAYVSDFDLLDGTFSVDHKGFGKRYPVRADRPTT